LEYPLDHNNKYMDKFLFHCNMRTTISCCCAMEIKSITDNLHKQYESVKAKFFIEPTQINIDRNLDWLILLIKTIGDANNG
jgi:hypothetical protein